MTNKQVVVEGKQRTEALSFAAEKTDALVSNLYSSQKYKLLINNISINPSSGQLNCTNVPRQIFHFTSLDCVDSVIFSGA
jgi:hypothetical protein